MLNHLQLNLTAVSVQKVRQREGASERKKERKCVVEKEEDQEEVKGGTPFNRAAYRNVMSNEMRRTPQNGTRNVVIL